MCSTNNFKLFLYSVLKRHNTLWGGNYNHVHFREVNGLWASKVIEVASGRARILARASQVINVILSHQNYQISVNLLPFKKVTSFTSSTKTCLISLKQLYFGDLSVSPSVAKHKKFYRSFSLRKPPVLHSHGCQGLKMNTNNNRRNPRGVFLLRDRIRWKHPKKWKKEHLE